MSEWRKVKLSDIAVIKKGQAITKNTSTPGIYPVILGGKEPAYYIDKYNHTGKAIVVSRSGASAGYISFWNEFIFVTDGFLIEPKDGFSHELVYYLLKNKQYNLTHSQSGAAIPHVTPAILDSVDLFLPPAESRETIATNPSRYDSLIENYQKQIKLLEEAAQRLYKEWFVDLRFPGHEKVKVVDGVPEGWERKKLIEIADVQYGFAFDGHLFNDKGEGTPILRIRNIPDGYTKDYTTQEATSEYIVNDGDIVVGMDGIFHINTWCGGKAYLVQRTCSFRPKKTEIKGFVLQAIYDPIKYFESTVVGATVAHLGKKHIDSIELLVPSDSKMFEALQKMYESRQNLLSQIRNLTESRDRMLVKLMSGEIEV